MMFVGANRIQIPTLESTNESLKMVASQRSIPEGTVLYANTQQNGKGQQGNVWHSEPNKNLTCTFYLKPNWLPIKDVFYLNAIAALAVHALVEEVLPSQKVWIKWPNDVLINNEKVAGILVENKLSSSKLEASFVGIGLNVNQVQFPEFSRRATSLAKHMDSEINLDQMLDRLSVHLQQYYMLLKTKGTVPVHTLYEDVLFLKNTPAAFELENGAKVMGRILGVLPSGKLQLERESSTEEFDLKQLKFLR